MKIEKETERKSGVVIRMSFLVMALFLAISIVSQSVSAERYVSPEAVEAFAAAAQGATTQSVGIYGTNTGNEFVNWCFNGVPDLVNALGSRTCGWVIFSLNPGWFGFQNIHRSAVILS